MKESGYNGGVSLKKPYINEMNRKKWLNFVKEIISKEDTFHMVEDVILTMKLNLIVLV